MEILVSSETSKLRSVIIGIADSLGEKPVLSDLYDPKSIENLKKGTYPTEKNMIQELQNFVSILEKYDIKVYRPELIKDYNQIFSRDIGFVIDNFFFKSNILPKRANEFNGITSILSKFSYQFVSMPENCHIEGGDVLYHTNNIFIGYYDKYDYKNLFTARTNKSAVEFLIDFFPEKKVKAFHLNKSLTDPKKNILHLDCCLQIVGKNKAIIHPDAFTFKKDYKWLVDFFGSKNIFEINAKEMYDMTSNVLSINDHTVISQPKFNRLNRWLRSHNIFVEEVDLTEVSKQEGLFRCASLPLVRYD
ncbi:MAG: dimethylarginine dimethylaminohydrolase family protein [Flavobacteriaceae bacterium]|nr:MAG: amidinotransferase [Cryomorphaceae bacterium]